ncbi:MAG TPA: NAD-dependent malic enzyme, partial [Ornithinibacter sp.]|nr:NAD-dependent malic enzyme [Ornithinibacter sp.]
MPSAPSIANSVTVRLTLPARATAVSEMTGVIEAAGGVVTGLDVTASGATKIRIDLTMLTHDPDHAETI